MQTIAVEMAMEYIFAVMNLLPIIFQKKAHTYVQRYKIFTDYRNHNLKVSCISPSLRLFKGLDNLNDLRVLRVLNVLRGLNFLKAPGFHYKKNGKACKEEMWAGEAPQQPPRMAGEVGSRWNADEINSENASGEKPAGIEG